MLSYKVNGDKDQGIKGVSLSHRLHGVGNKLAAGQAVFHTGVVHGNAVTNRHRVKLKRHTPATAYSLFNRLGDSEGRILQFPAQRKKFEVLLRHVVKAFKPGIRYEEKQVNEMLSFYSDDTATLRRSLVAHGMMEREGGGGKYWLRDD
jgi:hypothetical protein